MTENYLVDTHVWLWYALGDTRRLPPRLAERLTTLDKQRQLHLSVMSVWELAMLVAKNRIQLGCAINGWVDAFFERTRYQLLGVNIGVALDANALPGSFHPDPADRLIVATARHHRLTLITDDRKILDYGAQGHLRARASTDMVEPT